MKGKFFLCDCGSEALLVDSDDETGEFFFCLFDRGFEGRKYSLMQKLRHIWRIIWKGHPYTDEICLSKEKVMKLAKFLSKKVEAK